MAKGKTHNPKVVVREEPQAEQLEHSTRELQAASLPISEPTTDPCEPASKRLRRETE